MNILDGSLSTLLLAAGVLRRFRCQDGVDAICRKAGSTAERRALEADGIR